MNVKNIFYLILIPLITSCGTLRLSQEMHIPEKKILNRVNLLTDSLQTRLSQNKVVIRQYAKLDSQLNELFGQKILSLPALNLSASLQITNVLTNPPPITKLTDRIGLTRVRKSLSAGNTYIFQYVHDLWQYFYLKMNNDPPNKFDLFWQNFLSDYPKFQQPESQQINPITGELYIYVAFKAYFEALKNKETWTANKLHETILYGNLNFFLVEQLVAQNFIRKALTVRPLGTNPFNLGGRKVEVVLKGRTYQNSDNTKLNLSQIQDKRILQIVSLFDPLSNKPVKYHNYAERLPFILSIGIKEHEHFMKESQNKTGLEKIHAK